MIKLLSSFPTSVFTGALVFCLTWWILTTLFSGIDADADADVDVDIDVQAGHGGHVSGHGHGSSTHGTHVSHGHSNGHGRGGHGGHGGHGGQETHLISDALALGFVPLPLALTILSFGAWSVSLILQLLFRENDNAKLATGVAIIVLLVALAAGLLLLRLLRAPLGRLFDIEIAPERSSSVGATCRVRTLVVTDRLGDAEVISGPTRGSLIRVRADEGRFTRGDIALIIDYDITTEAFVIDDIDEHLLP